MTALQEQGSYMLGHRRQDFDEDRRLNQQHMMITQAIMGGRFIHNRIQISKAKSAIADICCGTGIWLDDVARLVSADGHEGSPHTLVGFDSNPHAFNHSLSASIKLIEHDCTKPFPTVHIDKYDLVNMRGLAYAIPEQSFADLIRNAMQLLSEQNYLKFMPHVDVS